jgi:hypothetical protein
MTKLTKEWHIKRNRRPPADERKDKLWAYRDKSGKTREEIQAEDVLEELAGDP